MILLDTHIFVWWIDGNKKLPAKYFDILKSNESNGLGISIISFWEIMKLHEKSRLAFECSIEEWFNKALQYPGISIINLDIDIILESSRLPGEFHKDPADQLIVSTARTKDISLCTLDKKILEYPYIKLIE